MVNLEYKLCILCFFKSVEWTMDNGHRTCLSWSCELNCLHLVFIIINNVMGGKLKISTSAVEPIPIYNYGSNHNSDIQRIKPGETILTFTLREATSKAIDLYKPIIPDLEAT